MISSSARAPLVLLPKGAFLVGRIIRAIEDHLFWLLGVSVLGQISRCRFTEGLSRAHGEVAGGHTKRKDGQHLCVVVERV
jgi:hypothetical protein